MRDSIKAIGTKKEEIQGDEIDWRKLGENSDRILEALKEHDPVALKTAYKELFEVIYVGDMDEYGVRPLYFVLRSDTSEGVTYEDVSCVSANLAGRTGPRLGFFITLRVDW